MRTPTRRDIDWLNQYLDRRIAYFHIWSICLSFRVERERAFLPARGVRVKKLLLLLFLSGVGWVVWSGRYKPYLHYLDILRDPLSTRVDQITAEQERRRAEIDSIKSSKLEIASEIAAQKMELASIREEVRAAKEELESKRAEAARWRCEAEKAGFDAKVALKQAQCSGEWALYLRCEARVAKEQADNEAVGMLIGAGLAAATGGSSLLFSGAGLAAGRFSADTSACEALMPYCIPNDASSFEEEVFLEEGRRPPRCEQ
jgi:hypothetical protein